MREKAILIYSSHTGKKSRLKHIEQIVELLKKSYKTVDVFKLHSIEEGRQKAVEAASSYDSIIIASGDGTFNALIDALSRLERIPDIGYINFGTLGDVGKNFGVNRSFRRSCKIINAGKTKEFDLCRINDSTFIYMAAAGCYSDISYVAKRSVKKKAGRFVYYWLAIKEAFKKQKHHFHIVADGKEMELEAPFVMALNGKYVGGFPVNKNGSCEDGLVELYASKPGAFNGLVHYFFHHGVTKVSARELQISSPDNLPWCIDGEKTEYTSVNIRVLQRKIRIFSAK